MADYIDLAPTIYRQRLIVEAVPTRAADEAAVQSYLVGLGGALGMQLLGDPVTHRSPRHGWAGWVHWSDSGAHLYAWDEPRFVSVDIYTCLAFEPVDATRFTQAFFDASAITAKAV